MSFSRIIIYECSCGANLWLTQKQRPVCRACGKQMVPTKKRVEGILSRKQLQSHNLNYKTMEKKP